jgi:hypothetical protein
MMLRTGASKTTAGVLPRWLITMVLTVASLLAGSARAEPACGDFLRSAGRKPARVEFVDCRPGHVGQVRALVATYRVSGDRAAAVESYLRRHTKMARLKRTCCTWEPDARGDPRYGSLPSRTDYPYEISMGTEENLVSRREDWKQIPWFIISVTLPLESP